MRANLSRFRGLNLGLMSVIGRGFECAHPSSLQIGYRLECEDGVRLKITADDANLQLGNYVFIVRGCDFNIMNELIAGNHTLFAPGCFVVDHDHGIDPDLRIDEQPFKTVPIHIRSDACIGANAAILKGMFIGDGAVIAAGACIASDVPTDAIVGSVPAKTIGNRTKFH